MSRAQERWGAVYADAAHAMAARLPEFARQANHRWGGMRWPADAIPPNGVRPENAVYASEDTGEIRHLVVVLTGRTIGPSRVGAAYPFVPHGIPCDVAIRELHPHETAIEGEVSAVQAGVAFRFFEPLWGVKHPRYRPGTRQRVRFAAFGSALRAVAPNAKAFPGEIPSVLVPIGPGPSSRYGIHAPIIAWRGFWIGDKLFYALKLRLAEEGGAELAVDLYAGRHCFEAPFNPAPGMAVAGVIWLHGTLAD